MKNKIAVIIPCYKVKNKINFVLKSINLTLVNKVYIVDDCCPQNSGKHIKKIKYSKKIHVIFLKKNHGVGGATIHGFRKAISTKHTILIKIDGDGQHNPNYIKKFINVLSKNKYNYCKGVRLFKKNKLHENMPKIRYLGNIILTNITRFVTGFHDISDCLNGFIGIKSELINKINLKNLRKDYFFEQDLLFRLSLINAKIKEIPIPIKYFKNNDSNLNILKIIPLFLYYHIKNILIKNKILKL